MKKKHWLIAGLLAVVTFLLGLLANSIMNDLQKLSLSQEAVITSPIRNAKTSSLNRSILVNTLRGQQLPTLHSALGI